MLNAERALASLEKSGEALTGILEENANIERRTSNVEPKKIKERKKTPSVCSFRLFGSTFDVRRSALNVRCSYLSLDARCSYSLSSKIQN